MNTKRQNVSLLVILSMLFVFVFGFTGIVTQRLLTLKKGDKISTPSLLRLFYSVCFSTLLALSLDDACLLDTLLAKGLLFCSPCKLL